MVQRAASAHLRRQWSEGRVGRREGKGPGGVEPHTEAVAAEGGEDALCAVHALEGEHLFAVDRGLQ